jgi:hypothetical protein
MINTDKMKLPSVLTDGTRDQQGLGFSPNCSMLWAKAHSISLSFARRLKSTAISLSTELTSLRDGISVTRYNRYPLRVRVMLAMTIRFIRIRD